MNTEVIQLIKTAAQEGVSLFIGDNRLQYKVRKGVKPDANLIHEIRNHKEQIFSLLKHQQDHENSIHKGIISRFDRATLQDIPLSFSQERLYFIDQMNGSREYHIHAVSRYGKELQIPLLEEAFREVIKRHEVLRTVIKKKEGKAFQYIISENNWKLNQIDSSTNDATESLIYKLKTKPFALDTDYMLRATVIHTETECILVIVMHHIATDGWSMNILHKEVFQLYQDKLIQQSSSLPALKIQYADYAVWQREYLKGEVLTEKLNFWKNYLKDSVALELPLDYNRPAVKEIEGKNISFLIDAATTKALNEIVVSEKITLFSLLLTSLKVLLYKYTGQDDICIGTPVANRGHKSLESLIGFFVNTIVLRSHIEAKNTFVAFAKKMHAELLEAYKHQDAPFEKVVDAISKERSQSRSLLFDVLFAFQNQAAPSDVEISPEQHDKLITSDAFLQFDLTFNIKESGNCLQVSIGYLTSLFKQETIEQMCNHFKTILKAIAVDEQQELQQINIVTEAEKQKLLYDFNEFGIDYPKEKTLVDLFETQVAKTPNNTAVVFENKKLSYTELNEKANQLAHFLRTTYAIQPDDLIGVLQDRTEWMVITLLAVLKSGGAYVPIDPNYPEDRIAYMTEDSNCKVVVDAEFLKEFSAKASNYDSTNPTNSIVPQNLAYVIYTSGTTGNPKGTLIEHENVVRLLKTEKPLFDFNEKDVWVLFHSYCFDFSVWEMYGALLFGGKLVVAPFETAKDTNAFIDLLIKEKVTVLNQTPSSFYNLIWMETERLNKELSLRYVIFGGEALSPGNLKKWNLRYPAVKLINMYGITETTVHVTYKEITKTEIDQNISNIGVAIPTLSCYVLDQEKNLVPIGIVGELYVGGAGVARGYLNRPELTNDRFIQNPFKPAEKLYRSGDKVRLLHNGEMEYLGRIDNQVKIRGYRIELGEIENAIKAHAAIKNVALLVKTLQQGHAVLIAFVVSDEAIDLDELKFYLKEKLPNYMVPGIFLQIENLPVNHNGKLDRKVLLELVDVSSEDYVAPRNETEEKLVAIWQELLHLERISITDDFFLIGGDSIILIRLISQIKNQFQKEVQLRQVYEYPTIADLAKLLTKEDNSEAEITALRTNITKEIDTLKQDFLTNTANAEFIEDVYPMSDIQKGMVFEYLKSDSESAYHDQFVYTIPVVEIDIFKTAMQLLVKKHEILRTGFNLTDAAYGLQVVYKQTAFDNITYEDITSLKAKEQEAYIKEYLATEKNNKFQIANAPLWRAKLFKISNKSMIYVFQFHHAIIDGWSLASLNAELNTICNTLLDQKEVTLKPLQVTNKQAIISNMVSKENKQNHVFWKDYLAETKRLDIFTEKKQYEVIEEKFEAYSFSQVKQAAQDLGITLRTLFLGTYLYAIKTIIYDTDITIGLVTNNRPAQEDGDKILGCFLNTIPFRVKLDNNALSWKEFLQGIHTNLETLNATDRLSLQDISNIIGHKDITNNPFFDIIFNFVNFHVYDQIETAQTIDESETVEDNEIDIKSFENTNTYFDFSISITGEKLNSSFKLKRGLKSETRLADFVSYFKHIFNTVIETPEALVKDIAITSLNNAEAQLKAFNATKVSYPTTKTIVDLFEEQVESTPNAIAIEFENEALTYEELNKKANLLAHYLRLQGIQEESLAGICLDRSLEMIIGLLGILKAGGAYVPIDPTYPVDRIKYILNDIQSPVLLTTKEHVNALSEIHNNLVVIDAAKLSGNVTENPKTQLAPTNLMYVIYTSGSTGKPKGVMNQHDGVVNRLLWANDCYQLTTEDIILQKTTYCFDVSVWELFLPLITGVKLILAKPEGHKDNRYLKELIETKNITTTHFVPSMLAMFLADIQKGDCPSLKQVSCSGEALKVHHVKQFRECFSNTRLINLYGPTEAAIDVTVWDAPMENTVLEKVSIGTPIANTGIYILDTFLQKQPLGVVGELCISGIQVARGYLNREELTQEKFIQNPYKPQERLYRTGDLARWNADGTIDFLGRKDTQVKIRGLRIELGEVEQVLLGADEHISQVVAFVQEVNQQKVIVAYMVSEKEVDKQKVRITMAQKLPDYMMPSYFVQIPSIPLTPNGKIDKKSLPVVGSQDVIQNTFVAPKTAIEKVLVGLCEEILKIEKVGTQDSFFELGGNSLNAIQLASKLRLLGYHLDIVQVLKTPKLASLATYVTRLETSVELNTIIKAEDYTVPTQLSENQKQYFGSDDDYMHATGSFIMIFENYDENRFQKVIYKLVEKLPSLRLQFYRNEQSEVVQLPIPLENFNLAISEFEYDNLQENRQEVEAIFKKQRNISFELQNGKVMRITVCKDKQHAAVQIAIHHIVTDDYSNRLIKLYIESAYRNEFISTQEIKEGYQIYQKLQAKYVQSSTYSEKKHYWETTLLPVLEKSKPLHATKHTSLAAKEVVVSDTYITGHTFELVKNFAQQHGCTIGNVIQALVCINEYQHTGQTAYIFNSALNGRDADIYGYDLSIAIGQFSNVIPLAILFEEEATLMSIIKAVQQKYVSARKHQEVPYKHIEQAITQKSGLQLHDYINGMFNSNEISELLDENLSSEVTTQQRTQYYSLDIKNTIYSNGIHIRYSIQQNADRKEQAIEIQFTELIQKLVANSTLTLADLAVEKIN